jgi:hypothetical protein
MSEARDEEEEEEAMKIRRGTKRRKDIPGITTFLTSLLTMRTSNPNLSPFLPRWGHVIPFPFLSIIVVFMVMVIIVIVLMVWWRDCTVREE